MYFSPFSVGGKSLNSISVLVHIDCKGDSIKQCTNVHTLYYIDRIRAL